jgi:hypothetical protein
MEEIGYRVLRVEGLHRNIKVDNSRKSRRYQLLARILSRISSERLSHIRYLQFGFQAVRVG